MTVVSSELLDLITLADRIVVMAGYLIQGALDRSEYSRERILRFAYGQDSKANRKKA